MQHLRRDINVYVDEGVQGIRCDCVTKRLVELACLLFVVRIVIVVERDAPPRGIVFQVEMLERMFGEISDCQWYAPENEMNVSRESYKPGIFAYSSLTNRN